MLQRKILTEESHTNRRISIQIDKIIVILACLKVTFVTQETYSVADLLHIKDFL